MRTRELSTAERFIWGECPICKASDGEPCIAEVGLQLGQRIDGRRMQNGEGAHLGRLNRAPALTREVRS